MNIFRKGKCDAMVSLKFGPGILKSDQTVAHTFFAFLLEMERLLPFCLESNHPAPRRAQNCF